MSNAYDVLFRTPKLHRRLKREQEALARAIVASGKIRLDADHNEANFTRLLIPSEGLNLTFSVRELTDASLRATAEKSLARRLLAKHGAKAEALARDYLVRAAQDIKKRVPIPPDYELKMARALVLCNELPAICLIHHERADIFISFGHNVGEVLDVSAWQQHGANSGMQAAGGGENAVYVSCGGNPFLSEEERRHSGDGWAALARFMVIAGQETGHNADMIRAENGAHVGRFSAEGWGHAPSERAGKARRADIKTVQAWQAAANKCGLARLCEWERQVKFYVDLKMSHPRKNIMRVLAAVGWLVFVFRMKRRGMGAIMKTGRSKFRAKHTRTFLNDMAFNLAPQADVYRRKNPREEEAILTIEAVARVPQQVVKWGHRAVKATWPQLYALYYNEIIPACVRACARYNT